MLKESGVSTDLAPTNSKPSRGKPKTKKDKVFNTQDINCKKIDFTECFFILCLGSEHLTFSQKLCNYQLQTKIVEQISRAVDHDNSPPTPRIWFNIKISPENVYIEF